jgi:glycosyltransferase involved in cell wall biosynthesis
VKILVLSEFMNDYEEKASFKIRYLTALKMAERGHDVVFMYPSNNSGGREGLPVSHTRLSVVATPGLLPNRFRVGGFGILDMICKVLRVLRDKFDVVYATNGHRPSQFLPCFVGKHAKGALTVDECWEWLGRGGYADLRTGFPGAIVSLYDRSLEVLLRRSYDRLITISETLSQRFGNRAGVAVIHGGAETDTLISYPIPEARKRTGLGEGLFLIGISNVTEIDHRDNVVLFEAVEKLCGEFANMSIVITGADTPYVRSLKESFGFSGRMIFPGWVSFEEYNAYLSSCNVFFLGNRDSLINRARWPNKIGDYLSLERPIITHPTGDVETYFNNYKIGFLCEETPESVSKLLRSIVTGAMELSPYARDSLRLAREVLSFDGRVAKILEFVDRTKEK